MNPLLLFWSRVFAEHRDEPPPVEQRLLDIDQGQSTTGILLVLRRMRVPLIVLIVIFAVSVLGLSLIPGQDAQGRSTRLSLFDAFYFMSFTATTIGFGEIPHSFTPAQRLWVTFAIFLSVVGWAYAVGSLLALVQDRAFRRALARQLFARKVAHMEPFLLLVGYGHASKRLARSLDAMGRRFVVIDRDENKVAAIDLDSYRADTPALLGDARSTGNLALAGLAHPHCEGVIAVSDDDDTNLDVTMTAGLLRPGLPVIARTGSRAVADRMLAFGAQEVVNPLDRFGDHLRILLRSPASYQLMLWLTSAPGAPLPERRLALPKGRWVVCSDGALGEELVADLRAEGLDVTLVQATTDGPVDAKVLAGASAVVAASGKDTTNLTLLEMTHRLNPAAYRVALQNRPGNAALFEAIGLDFGMVPAELIAHEVLARLANPALMRFLPQVPRLGESWAVGMVDRLVERCGTASPHLWLVTLGPETTPAVVPWLDAGTLEVGALFRSPQGRERAVDAAPLALLRGPDARPAPVDDEVLRAGDQLLVAGRPSARRVLDATVTHPPTAAYVVEGRFVPSSWVWRRLTGVSG